MNRTVIEKCLQELSVENPRLDYVRGMLETLLAMMPKEVSTAELIKVLDGNNKVNVPGLPPHQGGAYLDELKRMSGGMS